MKELFNALPDDRPITALCLVEEVAKCPHGYVAVAKSYDQDLDADLWKDGFFGKHATRYLCLSKSEGPSGFVIDSLCIINEKDAPPNGYVLLSKTYASEQKAWRKRQLCYRLTEKSSVFLAITDIIILSKSKKAPDGFTLAGEMNGLVICYKSAPLPAENKPFPTSNIHQVNINTSSPQPAALIHPISPSPAISKTPARPAPLPPLIPSSNRNNIISSSTLSGFTGLEGVPFILGKQIDCIQKSSYKNSVSKTSQELNNEYRYSFSTEREAMLRL